MLAAWMVYSTLLGAMLAAGALALERVIAMWNGARRVIWSGALAGAVVIPSAVALRPAGELPPRIPPAAMIIQRIDPTASSAAQLTASHATARRSEPLTLGPSDRPTLVPGSRAGAPALQPVRQRLERVATALRGKPEWNRYAAALWVAMSTVLMALFVTGMWAVRRRRATWGDAVVDGLSVLVADDVGPAVVGAVCPRIVLPAWSLRLSANDRALMLRHEMEHVAAGDPRLLLATALSFLIFPWNAALWFIARRLRLAIEIDCDTRVLRAVDRPREYGLLLLAVGARHATALPYAAALVERRRLLERRILAMTTVRPSRPLLASLPFIALAAIAVTLAAQTPAPAPIATWAPRAGVRLAARPARTERIEPAHRDTIVRRAQSLPSSARAATDTPQQPRPKHINANWDNAQIDWVIEEFARFSKRTIRPSPRVQGLVTATIVDLPWDVALRQVMNANGYEVTVDRDSTIIIDSAAGTKPSRPPGDSAEIPLEVLRAWVAQYHPSVMRGDTAIELVTFLVDANEHYVKSVAGKQPEPRHATPMELLRGIPPEQIERVEVLKGRAAAAQYGPAAVDGVIIVTTKNGAGAARRVGVDSAASDSLLSALSRRTVGSTAVIPNNDPLYIIDGVIVNRPEPPTPTPLQELDVASDQIQSVQVLKLAAGQIGPNPLRVVVVKLKGT